MSSLAAVILSAGESSRMGSPKALLPYLGTTFLEHASAVLDSFFPAKLSAIYLVLGHEAARIQAAVNLPASVTVLINERYKLGQLSSLHCALGALEDSRITGLLVAPVDHPCFDRPLVEQLLDAFQAGQPGTEVLVPVYQGRRGHPMIFAAALFPALRAAPLDRGARAVVRSHRVTELPVENPGILADIDDRESYERFIAGR